MKLHLLRGAIFIAGICCIATARADDPAHVMFPFAHTVDERKGTTDGLPNRIKDRDTGMWYVYVPGGTYRIGDDNLADSKAIDVKLSPFYFSESEVAYSQIQKFLEAQITRASGEVTRAANVSDDAKLVGQVAALSALAQCWYFDLALDQQDSEVLDRFMDGLGAVQDRKGPRGHGDDKRRNLGFTLTAQQRSDAKVVLAAFDAKIAKTGTRNDDMFGHASFNNAEDYAQWRKVRLPTEAQWEVAAQLAKAGTLRGVANMFEAEVLEWCADYYAHDYFFCKSGFENPTGPRSGKLSDKEVRNETTDSSLPIFTAHNGQERGRAAGW